MVTSSGVITKMVDEPHILTDNQLEIFKRVCEGMSAQEIAIVLGKEPGYIRKTKSVIRKKLEKEFKKIAKSLRLDFELSRISKKTGLIGLMIGFDWVHNTKVYLVFTNEEGILAWYEHDCSEKCQSVCEDTLNLIKRERGIKLDKYQESMSILDQFRLIISKINEKSESG